MKTTSLVLGIVGGSLGILAAILVFLVGSAAAGLEADGGGQIATQGFIGFLLAVVAIVGGALAGKAPGWASALLAIAALGGFIAVGLFWVLSGPLLIVGAFLAFFGRRQERKALVVPASA